VPLALGSAPEVLCQGVSNPVIPFPSEQSAPGPGPISFRRRLMVKIGTRRYAFDIRVAATALPPSQVTVIPSQPRTQSVSPIVTLLDRKPPGA